MRPRPGAADPTGASASRTPSPAHGTPSLIPGKIHVPRTQGVSRERLERRVEDLWRHHLALVVAPAGSGKTTLLAEWAAVAGRAGAAVAWYRAESTDGDPATFLGFLEAAVVQALVKAPPGDDRVAGPGSVRSVDAGPDTLERGWTTPEDAAEALERWPGERLLLVIDDLHTLAGTPAEATLERLIDYAGRGLAVAAGTRALPGFDLSRRRVSGELLEIGGDDLRFRPWEVETLFRDFYGERLRGDELARLARRTEGWAAGLQLFHLATRGMPAAERSRFLEGLAGSSRLVREYLTRNVLDELPEELRQFLVDTCVLRRLSGQLCDRLLGGTGSDQLLVELERRQVFTVAIDDLGTYRYHEVLRGHLEGVLVEEHGETVARERSAHAAAVLEEEGAIAEALAAWCRAGAWEEAERILGTTGDRLASGGGSWLDAMPPALLAHDPWLMLATARRHRAAGQWRQAVDAYGRAEAAFGGLEAAIVCRRERLALSAFLEPIPRPGPDWTGHLRSALARDPLGRRDPALGPTGDGVRDPSGERLANGLAALLAGRIDEARRLLSPVGSDPNVAPTIGSAANVASAVAELLAGDERGREQLEGAVTSAERAGLGWLARIGRAAVALDPGDDSGAAEAAALRSAAGARDDAWGELLGAFIEGWATLDRPDHSIGALDVATDRARRLGVGTFEAWSRSVASLAAARLGLPDARETALQAEALVRASGVPGARIPAHLALSIADPDRSSDHLELARSAAADAGLRIPDAWIDGPSRPVPDRLVEVDSAGPARGATGTADPAVAPRFMVRLFGGFSMTIDGRPIDLTTLKPRPRAVLRLLALNAGRPVHREVLTTAFWPDADLATAARNLHVALSGLRRVLGEEAARSLIVREGDAYRLVVPLDGRVDLLEFERLMAGGRAARVHGDTATAIDHYREALDLAGETLLPEDGPAEWVVGRREDVVAAIAEAARALGELLLPDDPDAAAVVCATGLRADPYHDPLWRLLIEARERAGDPAAASSARHGYAQMLDRLGLPSEDGRSEDGPSAPGLSAALLSGGVPAGGVTGGLGTRPR